LELKKFINQYRSKLSIQVPKDQLKLTKVDKYLGNKQDEIRKQQLDFDYKNFKEEVLRYQVAGGEMSVAEITQ
jgi:hypothetical protein